MLIKIKIILMIFLFLYNLMSGYNYSNKNNIFEKLETRVRNIK